MKDEDVRSRLRAATEADVEAVLAKSASGGDIELVRSDALLTFFNRMLDHLLPS